MIEAEQPPPPATLSTPTPGPGDAGAWRDAAWERLADALAGCGAVWDSLVHSPVWAMVWAWLLERLNGGVNNVVETLIFLAGAFLLSKVGLRWWRRIKGDRGPPGVAATALSPETLARLRDLLQDLPHWNNARSRRNFIEAALGPDHDLLNEIQWEGSGRDLAGEVAKVCARGTAADAGGCVPLCALLAAIPGEFGPDPARDADIAALQALLGCA